MVHIEFSRWKRSFYHCHYWFISCVSLRRGNEASFCCLSYARKIQNLTFFCFFINFDFILKFCCLTLIILIFSLINATLLNHDWNSSKPDDITLSYNCLVLLFFVNDNVCTFTQLIEHLIGIILLVHLIFLVDEAQFLRIALKNAVAIILL
jgi:hypothetical protein